MADIGRWGAIDPLSQEFLNFSPYNYALNSPLINIDPNGMRAQYVYEDDKYYKVKKNGEKKEVSFSRVLSSISERDKITIYQASEPTGDTPHERLNSTLQDRARFTGAMDFFFQHIYEPPKNYGFDQEALANSQRPDLSAHGVSPTSDVSDLKANSDYYTDGLVFENINYGRMALRTFNTSSAVSDVSWLNRTSRQGYGDFDAYHLAFWDSKGATVARMSFFSGSAWNKYRDKYYDKPRLSKYNNLFEQWYRNSKPSEEKIKLYNEYNAKKSTYERRH